MSEWKKLSEIPTKEDGAWVIGINKKTRKCISFRFVCNYDNSRTHWRNILDEDVDTYSYDLFMLSPEFPKEKVMIDGNELLQWIVDTLQFDWVSFRHIREETEYKIKKMIEEAKNATT